MLQEKGENKRFSVAWEPANKITPLSSTGARPGLARASLGAGATQAEVLPFVACPRARRAPPGASRSPGRRSPRAPAPGAPVPPRAALPGHFSHLRAHREHLRSRGSRGDARPVLLPSRAPPHAAPVTRFSSSTLADQDALLRRPRPLTSGPARRTLRLRPALTSGSRCLRRPSQAGGELPPPRSPRLAPRLTTPLN